MTQSRQSEPTTSWRLPTDGPGPRSGTVIADTEAQNLSACSATAPRWDQIHGCRSRCPY